MNEHYINMNELISCPFDSSHQVSRRKMQYHIVKCQKTYTGTKIACPYNASEFIEPEDLQKHLATCPSGLERLAHGFRFQENNFRRNIPEAPFFHCDIQNEPSERWALN